MKIIDVARAEVGTKSLPHNNNKYNTWYYGGAVSNDSLAWCVVFIRWCFNQLGWLDHFCAGIKTASCGFVMSWARNHGQWVTSDYAPGDLLLYDFNGDGKPSHIGIMSRTITEGVYESIEGNTLNSEVAIRNRADKYVLGAYRPEYPEDAGGEWSREGREWAVSKGLFSGYSDGEMHWTDPVTREQLAVILWRALK